LSLDNLCFVITLTLVNKYTYFMVNIEEFPKGQKTLGGKISMGAHSFVKILTVKSQGQNSQNQKRFQMLYYKNMFFRNYLFCAVFRIQLFPASTLFAE
jgi:hypothetical protein